MDSTAEDLRELIAVAVEEGLGLDEIEHRLLDPAGLPREEHDALWLYALAQRGAPHRARVPLVAG